MPIPPAINKHFSLSIHLQETSCRIRTSDTYCISFIKAVQCLSYFSKNFEWTFNVSLQLSVKKQCRMLILRCSESWILSELSCFKFESVSSISIFKLQSESFCIRRFINDFFLFPPNAACICCYVILCSLVFTVWNYFLSMLTGHPLEHLPHPCIISPNLSHNIWTYGSFSACSVCFVYPRLCPDACGVNCPNWRPSQFFILLRLNNCNLHQLYQKQWHRTDKCTLCTRKDKRFPMPSHFGLSNYFPAIHKHRYCQMLFRLSHFIIILADKISSPGLRNLKYGSMNFLPFQ